jgi:hypothetical protein
MQSIEGLLLLLAVLAFVAVDKAARKELKAYNYVTHAVGRSTMTNLKPTENGRHQGILRKSHRICVEAMLAERRHAVLASYYLDASTNIVRSTNFIRAPLISVLSETRLAILCRQQLWRRVCCVRSCNQLAALFLAW